MHTLRIDIGDHDTMTSDAAGPEWSAVPPNPPSATCNPAHRPIQRKAADYDIRAGSDRCAGRAREPIVWPTVPGSDWRAGQIHAALSGGGRCTWLVNRVGLIVLGQLCLLT